MAQIDAYKIQNGIIKDNDPRMNIVNAAKQLWVRQQTKDNLDWYSDYASPDRAKYERRAQVLQTALKDKKWMSQNGDRPVVKAMATYLEVRNQVGQLLENREKSGGSRSLSAQSNADVAYAFEKFKTQLIAESDEFGQFINRYFANDTVVL